jgi:uncharacterized protein YggU (UPF0235/DUF167 family)
MKNSSGGGGKAGGGGASFLFDGRELHVKLTPKAGSDRIGEVVRNPDGTCVLKAYVAAAPENDKANAALIALLAKESGLPKSAFTIVRGKTSRRKTVRVERG